VSRNRWGRCWQSWSMGEWGSMGEFEGGRLEVARGRRWMSAS